jgi:hypothetical protein
MGIVMTSRASLGLIPESVVALPSGEGTRGDAGRRRPEDEDEDKDKDKAEATECPNDSTN